MVEQKPTLPFLKRKQKKVKHSILVENEFQVFNKRNSFEGVQRNVADKFSSGAGSIKL